MRYAYPLHSPLVASIEGLEPLILMAPLGEQNIHTTNHLPQHWHELMLLTKLLHSEGYYGVLVSVGFYVKETGQLREG